MIELCINSSKNTDDGDYFSDGHAWLTLHDGEDTEGYGLYPDGDDMGLFASLQPDATSDVQPEPSASKGKYSYCEPIDREQVQRFHEERKRPAFWTPTNNCSSWSSETFHSITGTDVDADDEWMGGVETPRELGQNITRLNKQRPAPGVQ